MNKLLKIALVIALGVEAAVLAGDPLVGSGTTSPLGGVAADSFNFDGTYEDGFRVIGRNLYEYSGKALEFCDCVGKCTLSIAVTLSAIANKHPYLTTSALAAALGYWLWSRPHLSQRVRVLLNNRGQRNGSRQVSQVVQL